MKILKFQKSVSVCETLISETDTAKFYNLIWHGRQRLGFMIYVRDVLAIGGLMESVIVKMF